ncbi:MAG: DNA polymerase Y family protein, partial [Chthoniobacterales bacterium]
MYAAIILPQFRLQAVLRWRESGSSAIAVVDGDASKGVVLDATEAAEACGVGPGIPVVQAMARCETLRVLARVPTQERACSAALVEAGLAFSPLVEWTANGVVTVDLRGVPRSTCWQQLAERMIGRLAAVELRGHVGIAANPDHAMLAARCAGPICVVRNSGEFFKDLPLRVLLGDDTGQGAGSLLEILGDWGIRTVGEFARMPREAVIERLGPEAALVWRQLSGRTKRVLHVVSPPDEFVEAFEFERAVDTTDAVLFLLRRFVDSLGERLREAGKVAGKMTLVLPLDDGTELKREFSVPAPTTDAETLFRTLDTFLESLRLDAQPL